MALLAKEDVAYREAFTSKTALEQIKLLECFVITQNQHLMIYISSSIYLLFFILLKVGLEGKHVRQGFTKANDAYEEFLGNIFRETS